MHKHAIYCKFEYETDSQEGNSTYPQMLPLDQHSLKLRLLTVICFLAPRFLYQTV